MVNQTQTLDAEYSVIGALLLQPQIAGELFAATGEADFVRDELRSVYIAARDIWTAGRQLDPVTIRAAIGKAYEPLLMACMDTCSSWRMWRDYVAAMQEQTRVSRLHEIADRLAQVQTSDEARDLLADANAAAAEKSGVQVVTMTDALLHFFEEQSEKRKFIEYGFGRLDRRLYSDFGDFVVLAGRPSAGKTAMALQMATHMGRQAKVGFYSLETSPAKLANRIVSNRAFIDFGHINRREMTQEEWERIVRLKQEIAESDVELISASGWSVQDVLSCALQHRHKIVFIDYLQQLKGRGRDRFEQVTRISLDLHAMAQAHGIMVVALSQFSRVAAARDGEPTLTDLRESGQIEQDVDAVLALYINEDDSAPPGERVLQVLKNKEGTLGKFYLNFDGGTQGFAEYMDGERAVIVQTGRMEKKHENQKSNPKAAI